MGSHVWEHYKIEVFICASVREDFEDNYDKKVKKKKKEIENIRKSNIFMCCIENGWEEHPK